MMDILDRLSANQKRAESPIDALAMSDAAAEIKRLRSVVQIQNETLHPFACALKFARERLGKMPDIADTTALASRWVTYNSLKDALGVYNKYKERRMFFVFQCGNPNDGEASGGLGDMKHTANTFDDAATWADQSGHFCEDIDILDGSTGAVWSKSVNATDWAVSKSWGE